MNLKIGTRSHIKGWDWTVVMQCEPANEQQQTTQVYSITTFTQTGQTDKTRRPKNRTQRKESDPIREEEEEEEEEESLQSLASPPPAGEEEKESLESLLSTHLGGRGRSRIPERSGTLLSRRFNRIEHRAENPPFRVWFQGK